MECKELRKEINLVMIFVLIETLWNVKFHIFMALSLLQNVLIETLWNVKVLIASSCASTCAVLIETLWNVKDHKHIGKINRWGRINRNIVECKESLTHF